MRRFVLALLSVCALMPATPTFASDGMLEINQACAVQTGCFDGDAPGFPVTITASGSYQLTSNLAFPSATHGAIHLGASRISLDLAGHSIQGTNTCARGMFGWVTGCTAEGFSGPGIYGGAADARILNGHISGAAGSGISVGANSEVSNVQVSDCAGAGISVGSRSAVSSVMSRANLQTGIYTSPSSNVRESTSIDNGEAGILTGGSSSVRENMASNNGGGGIDVSFNSLVLSNVVIGNANAGIRADSGSTVDGNLVSGGHGVGLELDDKALYRRNSVRQNAEGSVTQGINGGDNYCNDLPICP